MIAERLKTYRTKLCVIQDKLALSAKKDKRRRFGILYDKVCNMETLKEAWKRVRANKGASGVDGVSIGYIEVQIGVSEFLEGIQLELKSNSYRPEKVRRVWIDKAGRKEKRPLGIPTVKDRVIQQAVKLIIEPIFEVDFKEYSYGFRPDKSAHEAVDKVSKYLSCGCQWVIDLDIKSYFDTIPHEKLIELLKARVTDKWIVKLIRSWLKAGILDKDKIQYQETGTPQGGVLSPLLANIYLNELDKMWEEKGFANRYRLDSHLIRYADDLVVMCPRKETAQRLFKVIEAFLAELGLKLNQQKSRIAYLKEGFDFLGFHFTKGFSRRKRKEATVKFPSAKATKSIRANIKETLKENQLGEELKEVVKRLNTKIIGWAKYFVVANSCKTFMEINRYANEQLRLFLRRRFAKKMNRGYITFPNRYLYEQLGLAYLPRIFSNRMQVKVC